MAEKTAPATIWACMEGPMVGLFVSGGYTAGWPKYTRADSHDKLVEALKAARIQLVTLGGNVVEIDGKIVSDAIQAAVLHVIDAALASLDQESGQ